MKDALHMLLGALCALMVVAIWFLGSEPDSPVKSQVCVPIYDQTGLECCQSTQGDFQ